MDTIKNIQYYIEKTMLENGSNTLFEWGER